MKIKGKKIKNEVINHKIRENTQRKIKKNLRDGREILALRKAKKRNWIPWVHEVAVEIK